MKRVLLIFFAVTGGLYLYSQAPESFSYHATIRNAGGYVIVDRAVSFRFGIIKGSPSGTAVYGEKHEILTDSYGSVSLIIGNGIEKTGDFTVIDWGADNYFLKVELDTTGGAFYSDMGTVQLLSVPYSLYSKTAGNVFSGNYNDLVGKPVTDGSETKISVGENLQIEGSGTISKPYIINTRSHYVGENYGGGIVFFVYDNGQHGLIAATRDQDEGVLWNNGNMRYTNTAGDGLNAGAMNTSLIIALQTNDNPTGNFAAKICADYSVTVDDITYGDWYLPSKFELARMFNQKNVIGGFQDNYYWSSTEFSSISAWSQNFFNGDKFNLNKSLPYCVRAIRSF